MFYGTLASHKTLTLDHSGCILPGSFVFQFLLQHKGGFWRSYSGVCTNVNLCRNCPSNECIEVAPQPHTRFPKVLFCFVAVTFNNRVNNFVLYYGCTHRAFPPQLARAAEERADLDADNERLRTALKTEKQEVVQLRRFSKDVEPEVMKCMMARWLLLLALTRSARPPAPSPGTSKGKPHAFKSPSSSPTSATSLTTAMVLSYDNMALT